MLGLEYKGFDKFPLEFLLAQESILSFEIGGSGHEPMRNTMLSIAMIIHRMLRL